MCNMCMLTRITDWKIQCVYIHVFQIIKNWVCGPYNFLCHADNRRYFLGLSFVKGHMFSLVRKVEKFGHVLAEKRVIWLMNSNMVKYGKIWRSLLYHVSVPLNTIKVLISKALLYVNYKEFVSVNNVLREYNERKVEVKTSKTAVE